MLYKNSHQENLTFLFLVHIFNKSH